MPFSWGMNSERVYRVWIVKRIDNRCNEDMAARYRGIDTLKHKKEIKVGVKKLTHWNAIPTSNLPARIKREGERKSEEEESERKKKLREKNRNDHRSFVVIAHQRNPSRVVLTLRARSCTIQTLCRWPDSRKDLIRCSLNAIYLLRRASLHLSLIRSFILLFPRALRRRETRDAGNNCILLYENMRAYTFVSAVALIVRISSATLGRNVIFPFSEIRGVRTEIKELAARESDKGKGPPLSSTRLWSDYVKRKRGAEIVFSLRFQFVYLLRYSKRNCDILVINTEKISNTEWWDFFLSMLHISFDDSNIKTISYLF